MSKSNRYAPQVRERAVRMVFDHQKDHTDHHISQWAAIQSIAQKIGCTAETLRKWVRPVENQDGPDSTSPSNERARITELERENRELRRANEILRRASAYFAQAELDRPLRR